MSKTEKDKPFVSMRADPVQRKRWERAARADRRSLSDWMRQALDTAARSTAKESK